MEWIPVSERLPEDDREKLVYYNGLGSCYVAYYSEGEWSNMNKIVTHWMPLPPSPHKD